jgi:diketogulonate reductase-like aldo/keto reductase
MNEIKTANGSIIPFIGMGTFPLQGRKMADTVKSAVKIGYRLIDTADDYRGEDGIGLAIDPSNKDFCKWGLS